MIEIFMLSWSQVVDIRGDKGLQVFLLFERVRSQKGWEPLLKNVKQSAFVKCIIFISELFY